MKKKNAVVEAIEASLVKARLGDMDEDEAVEPVAAPKTSFVRKDDPDPPFFDVMGRPTIRNKVDDLLYCSPRERAECEHEWGDCPYYELLKQCTKCKRTKMRKKARLNTLLPIFKDKIFPPTDTWGRYYEVCIVNKRLLLKRSWYTSPRGGWVFQDFVLFVKFPKGWLWTAQFSEFKFDRLIRDVDPLLGEDVEYDPKAVFNAAQRAIFGKSWGVDGGLNLERLA